MKETIVTGPPFSPKSLRALRAHAHALKPVVWISQDGLSEGALREVERALQSHELIKIHAALDDRAAREALLDSICEQLGAQAVQIIGKMLIAFRRRTEPDPKEGRAPASAKTTDRRAKRPEKRKPAVAAKGMGATSRANRATGDSSRRSARQPGKARRQGNGRSRPAKRTIKRT